MKRPRPCKWPRPAPFCCDCARARIAGCPAQLSHACVSAQRTAAGCTLRASTIVRGSSHNSNAAWSVVRCGVRRRVSARGLEITFFLLTRTTRHGKETARPGRGLASSHGDRAARHARVAPRITATQCEESDDSASSSRSSDESRLASRVARASRGARHRPASVARRAVRSPRALLAWSKYGRPHTLFATQLTAARATSHSGAETVRRRALDALCGTVS